METRSASWALTWTAIVLNLCKMQAWAAEPGPVPAPVPSLVIPSSIGATRGALIERTPTNESVTLLQLMTGSLNMSSAIKQNWTGTVCSGNVSSWMGVTCTLGKVTGLDLTHVVQGGTLPPQLYLLPNLTKFTCGGCSISGTLPKEWESFLALEKVDLYANHLTGTLPPWVGTIPVLYSLQLTFNNFTGTLPSDWASNPNLLELSLGHNRLTGTLPPAWGSMTSLTYLDLGSNRLSGTLPNTFGKFGRMRGLVISNNALTGSLPPSWATMVGPDLSAASDFVDFDYDKYSGHLQQLDPNLKLEINLSDNQLTGPLPPGWVNISALKVLELFGNRLTGTLPAEWSSFQDRMKRLWLHDNAFTGTLPPEWGALTGINLVSLNNNSVTGTLPPSWGSMKNVSDMSLSSNRLSGTLPNAWGGMTSMATLSLSSNHFSGSIPGNSWALGMQRLARLYIQNNSLTGQLPAEWFSTANAFPSLLAIDVRWNELHGPVPEPTNGSLFLSTVNGNLKLYAVPMDKGYGLCVDSPKPGQIFFESQGQDWDRQFGDEGHVTTLPLCRPGSGLSRRALISIAIGCSSLIAAVSVIIYIVMSVRRRNAGSSVGNPFLSTCFGSCKIPFPKAWHILETSGGIAGRAGSKSGKAASNTGTSGLTPTATGRPLPGSGSSPPITTDSGPATDSARGGRGTSLSSSDKRMSKTSSLSGNVSRGGMRAEDLIFAKESNNTRVTLGSGAFGQVYKASWHGTDVAVKVLRDDHLEVLLENELPDDVEEAHNEQQQQFEREAALLSTLRHPNIVNFLGFIVNGTDMMVVTELCDGGDLAKAMRQHRHAKAMGWYTRGAKLSLDVACGLAYLHTMGVIHYDIKPANILLDNLGSTAKISDVGLSKSLTTLQGTVSNTVRGTLEYMAPELMFGLRLTFAVDVYSFGVMLREIITGEPPDKRAGPPREPRIPEECPEAAWRLYWRCIDPDPSNRPSSSELVEHLRDLQPPPQANPGAMAPTPKDSKEKMKSRNKVDGQVASDLESTPEQETTGQEEKHQDMV